PFAVPNPQRFGQAFSGRVANPRDLIHFVRKRAPTSKPKILTSSTTVTSLQEDVPMRVEDMVRHFLDGQQLDLFPQNEFGDIVRVAVEKDDKDTISTFVKSAIERVLSHLPLDTHISSESIKCEFERF